MNNHKMAVFPRYQALDREHAHKLANNAITAKIWRDTRADKNQVKNDSYTNKLQSSYTVIQLINSE